MIVKLLTEHHLEFLSLKGGCRSLSESTHVKMPHCWKSHVMAQICKKLLLTVIFNSLSAGDKFCRLLILKFANILNLDQARLSLGPDLDPNRLTLW